MKNKSKEYKISQELRKIAYMLCMVAVIFLADIAVVNATSEDDGAAAERILDNQIEENENRTNINDPGTAEPPELVSLAAYVSEDGLVGHQWKERPIGRADFICLSAGELQGREVGVGGWGSGGWRARNVHCRT